MSGSGLPPISCYYDISAVIPYAYGLQPRACPVCDKKQGLSRCAGCHSVYYCCYPHQKEDWPDHKAACTELKDARSKYELQHMKLHRLFLFDTPMLEPDGDDDVIIYLGRRLKFISSLLQAFGRMDAYLRLPGEFATMFRTRARLVDAVGLALGHALDIVHKTLGAEMTTRYMVPGLFISLGRDQEAYDFLKWWATAGLSYNPYTSDRRQFLDTKDADPLEDPVEVWLGTPEYVLPHVLGVVIIKVRALLDMQAIQSTRRAFRGSLPNEVTDLICKHRGGPIVGSRPDILNKDIEDMGRLIVAVKGQILRLYDAADYKNRAIWPMIINTKGEGAPFARAADSRELMMETFSSGLINGSAWVGTPGAIGTIRKLRSGVRCTDYFEYQGEDIDYEY